MKLASLQYSYSFPENFSEYEKKIRSLVEDIAKQEVELLLFPEYAGYEIASMKEWEKQIPAYLDLFKELSREHQMYICPGTQVFPTEKGTFNRAFFFAPNGQYGYQDKCNLFPHEIEKGILSPGDSLRLFETKFGKIGICVSYDAQFPKVAETLIDQGAQLILVPSYTSSTHGFYRVLTSCRSRALEQQCYVVQSAIVGQTDVEIAIGAAAVCTPIDTDFPEDGLLAMGSKDHPETVIATLDFTLLEKVRSMGQTHNFADAQKLKQRTLEFQLTDLR